MQTRLLGQTGLRLPVLGHGEFMKGFLGEGASL